MTDRPKRIQRQRTKGWKMPPNTVYVGRPTIWGNHHDAHVYGQRRAKDKFAEDVVRGVAGWPGIGRPLTVEMIQRELGGKNLACWCREGSPCHADVLLELANPNIPVIP